LARLSVIRDYFHVGEHAPDSGIYRAIHRGHRRDHNVILLRGDDFPQCRFCKNEPLFLLVESAEYVAHDLDFAGLSAATAL
jgi:hypothetical protein